MVNKLADNRDFTSATAAVFDKISSISRERLGLSVGNHVVEFWKLRQSAQVPLRERERNSRVDQCQTCNDTIGRTAYQVDKLISAEYFTNKTRTK